MMYDSRLDTLMLPINGTWALRVGCNYADACAFLSHARFCFWCARLSLASHHIINDLLLLPFTLNSSADVFSSLYFLFTRANYTDVFQIRILFSLPAQDSIRILLIVKQGLGMSEPEMRLHVLDTMMNMRAMN